MELDAVIKERRSIRKYSDKMPKFEVIHNILESARSAPTSGNLQDFRFIVVHDKKTKEEIAEASLNQTWMNSAPVFIVVCSDVQRLESFYKERAKDYSLQNSAAAAMLISLKAVDLDLSTCWVNIFDQNAVSRILKLSPNIKPLIILTLGYKEENPKKPLLKIPLSRITFFNKFRNKSPGWPIEKYLNIKEVIKKKLK
ncbi:nitroreductase family protein [Candidatus Woesearchaeota archaeon]|nr:nitroreductase family protein [Candidatus Woesearchaeota archaeon]